MGEWTPLLVSLLALASAAFTGWLGFSAQKRSDKVERDSSLDGHFIEGYDEYSRNLQHTIENQQNVIGRLQLREVELEGRLRAIVDEMAELKADFRQCHDQLRDATGAVEIMKDQLAKWAIINQPDEGNT